MYALIDKMHNFSNIIKKRVYKIFQSLCFILIAKIIHDFTFTKNIFFAKKFNILNYIEKSMFKIRIFFNVKTILYLALK